MANRNTHARGASGRPGARRSSRRAGRRFNLGGCAGVIVLVGVVVLAVALLVSRTSPSNDDGHLFLSRFLSTPTPTAAPVPTGTPVPARVASPRPVVFLDPGHGGVDQGTSGQTAGGPEVLEKTTTLAIAEKTAAVLQADGVGVVLSRTDDSLPGSQPTDYTPDGKLLTPQGVLDDLQRRIDRANASGAQVMLSIHLNGFSDPAVGGSETFYDPARPFADGNLRFAQLVQTKVVAALRTGGYNVPDRGVTDDTTLQGDDLGALGVPYNHLVLLGPEAPGRLRASQMPGALSEPLFLTNPVEATAASQAETQDALAHAYADAIETFLRG
jgi:N-acetylmuramoyl-L-alanine amidase